MKHAYLNIGESEYKKGYKSIGTSNNDGNGLNDTSVTEVQIPSRIDSRRVIELRSKAFSNTNIEKIFIPNSILSIGNSTFLNCTQLSEVRFEEGSRLEVLGHQNFYCCSKLEKIDFPASINVLNSNSPAATLFFGASMISCVSYLGKTNFESVKLFLTVPSRILVSSLYPSSIFGKQNVTQSNGETCGTSKEPFVPIPKTRIICSHIIQRSRDNYYNYIFFIILS